MGQHYSHLDLDDRRLLARLWDAKVPVRTIAARLGGHRSSIHREINRNFHHTSYRDHRGKDHRGYYAVAAQTTAQQGMQPRLRISSMRRLIGASSSVLAGQKEDRDCWRVWGHYVGIGNVDS